jgi:hypothetical protein
LSFGEVVSFWPLDDHGASHVAPICHSCRRISSRIFLASVMHDVCAYAALALHAERNADVNSDFDLADTVPYF